jgi:hypothetical protein
MLGDILEKIEWNETDDVRIFFTNIYPFLDVSFNKMNYFFYQSNFIFIRMKD